MSRVIKLISILSFFIVTILPANEVQYISLPKDSDGNGLWQMVGVAGFDEDEYSLELTEANRDKFTAWYCEDERVKIEPDLTVTEVKATNLQDGYSYTKLLIAIKVDNENINYLTLNNEKSQISCKDFQSNDDYTNNNATPDEMLVKLTSSEINSVGTDLTIRYPDSQKNEKVRFFLNNSPSEVFELSLDYNDGQTVTVEGITDEEAVKDIYNITKPIEESVDLYLNDNPGFDDENNSNWQRAKSDYNPKFHRIPLAEDGDTNNTLLSRNSTLKVYGYNSLTNMWEFYNSDDDNETNTLTELKVGRGYWMKLDNKVDDENSSYYTLELNSSYSSSSESNLSILNSTDTTKSWDLNFSTHTADTIVNVIESNFTDINSSVGIELNATVISGNSVLLVAKGTIPKIEEKTDTTQKDAFLNVPHSESMFTGLDDIKSGLVLGDSHIKIENQEIYKELANRGWNLLTLPEATIRESVTGLIATPINATITISDQFNSQIVTVSNTLLNGDATTDSLAINKTIQEHIEQEKISKSFYVRAYPIDGTKILFISNDKFSLSGFGNNVVNFKEENTTYSEYGDYALAVQVNTESDFVKSGNAKITLNNNIKSAKDITDSNFPVPETITTTDADEKSDFEDYKFKSYSLDYDFNGSDASDLLLITAKKPFSIEDITFTRTYEYNESEYADAYISIYDGDTSLKTGIEVEQNTSLSNSGIVASLDSIAEINATASGNYLFVTGTTRENSNDETVLISNLDIKESKDNPEDLLKDITWIDNNLSKGALLKGFQGSTLAKAEINSSNGYTNITADINDISAIPFRTLDLMSENSLITLSSEDGINLLPTMIIGSDTNTSTGNIYWRTLNVTRKPSKWFDNYNLFSTDNQKAYWVYLTDMPDEKPVAIGENPTVDKNYLRHFNNESGEVNNYPLLNISTVVNGLVENDIVEGYVAVSLLNGGAELAKREFHLSDRTVDTYKGVINFLDIEEISKDYMSDDTNITAENIDTVLIKATDGRTYTDKFSQTIDLMSPKRPQLSFKSMNDLKISVEEADGVNKFLIFKDSIDDFSGIDMENTELKDEDKENFILEVPLAQASETEVTDLCQYVNSTDFDKVKLLVVALDNEDTTQANVSDMERIYYVPFKNVHTLTALSDKVTVKKPTIYGDECTAVNDDSIDDSGVQLRSLNNKETRLVYRPIDGVEISTGMLEPMRVSDGSSIIANIDFSIDYLGKKFFLYNADDSKLYEGTFTKDKDSETTALELTQVKSGSFTDTAEVSDQKIGQ